MTTGWVALLRGVNVNGITIRSAELKALFADELGLDGVRTVLASGNVRFDAKERDRDRSQLKARIEKALRERFGYDAWIVLVTLAELETAVAGFPFEADDASRQPYVVFGSDQAVLDEIVAAAASLDTTSDPVAAAPGVVYWHPAVGTSTDTPFARLLGKARFKSTTTTRNLRTLVKIAG